MTRSLRDLLSTWENWSARRTYREVLHSATTDAHRQVMLDAIEQTPHADPLDALADVTELVSLLTGWQWQAVYEARTEEFLSWEQVAAALRVSPEQARVDYLAVIERMEAAGVGDTAAYRRAV